MNAKAGIAEVQDIASLVAEVRSANISTLDAVSMSVTQLKQLGALFMTIEKTSDDRPCIQKLAELGNYLCADWADLAGMQKEDLKENLKLG